MGATMIRTGRRDARRAALRRRLAGTLAGLTILAAGALPMAGASPAGATTPACQDQWTNPAGGAWATSTNWSAGVPSASEVACVTIATTAPVTASSITVGGLVVGATAGAAGTSSLAVAGTTTVTGSATVLATGAMSASGTYDQTAGTLLVDGTLSQPANLTLKGAGRVVVGTTGVLVASHQLLLDGPGTLTNRGAVVASAGSSLYADPSPGTMTFDNAGGVLLDEDADVQIQAGATFVEGAGAAVGTAQVSTVDAAVRVAGGTLDLAGSGSSSFLLQNGTLEGTIAQGQLVDAVGTNASSGPLVNHGSLVFPTGGTFTIDTASSLDNEGLVVERGGQLGLSGTFDNAADGTVSVDTSQLVLQGAYDLDNLGTVAIGANGDVLATHTSGLASTVENAGGTIANGHAGASGFTADAGVTFTEGAGTTTGNAVQVDGALDLTGTGASSFLVSSGSLTGTIAADQDVTAQGTVTTSASVDNRGTLVLRALNFDLAAGTTLTNDGVLGLAGGESNVDGNLTNAADGTLTVDHGSELVDPTAGTAITNAGELYLLDGDEVLGGAGVAISSTGDVHFGLEGGSWGSFGLASTISVQGSPPQTLELGGTLEPVYPATSLPAQWQSGDGSSIVYEVGTAPSASSPPFDDVTCSATVPSAYVLTCSDTGSIHVTEGEPGSVPTSVTIASSAPSVSGPCGTPACPDSSYGQSVTLTATVAPEYGSTAPTGTVVFFDGPTPIGTSAVSTSGGVTTATLTTSAFATGLHEFSATYSGDAGDVAGDSSQLEAAVGAQTPTVTLAAPTASSLGSSVRLTATVTPAGTAPNPPTGDVEFVEGSNLLGIAPVATVAGTTTAALATTALTLGAADQVTATYVGDVGYATAASGPSSIDVGAADVLRVLTDGPGAGTVSGAGTACAPTCTAVEPDAATVVLHAVPAAGSALRSFSGACTGAGACHVTMAGTETVVATFVPSATHLRASLAGQLAPTGRGARLGAIAKAKGYAYRGFALLEAGTARVTWTHVHGRTTTVVATGTLTLAGPGRGTLTVALTSAGATLLKGARSLVVAVAGSFTPSGGARVTASTSVTLHA